MRGLGCITKWKQLVWLILWTATADTVSAVITPVTERLGVCPGETVNYACTEEGSRDLIRWSISCYISTAEMSCQSKDPEIITVHMSDPQASTLCGTSDDTAIDISSDIVRGVSNVNFTAPESTTINHLEFSCGSSSCRYLHIIMSGNQASPENFTHLVNYSSATDSEVVVTLMWSPGLDGVDTEYTLLTDSMNNSITTSTTNTNWTTSLQFNQTYHVTLYSTTCGGAFSSDNFTTNITIELPSSCPPPVLPAGVELTTIVSGSVIAYQCGEGLVPEGRVEALCGADGNWRPQPENFTCSEVTTFTLEEETTTIVAMEPITGGGSTNSTGDGDVMFIIIIIGGSVLGVVILSVTVVVIAILLCFLALKKRKAVCEITAASPTTVEDDDTYAVLNYKGVKRGAKRNGQGSSAEMADLRSVNTAALGYSQYILNEEDRGKNYSLATLSHAQNEVTSSCTENGLKELSYDEIPSLLQALPTSSRPRVEEATYSEVGVLSRDHTYTTVSKKKQSKEKPSDTQDKKISSTSEDEGAGSLGTPTGVPDLDNVVDFLRPKCDIWYSLGAALKIPQDKLQAISTHYKTDFDCMVEVCDTWLAQVGETPSWQPLLLALEEVGSGKEVTKHGRIDVPLSFSEDTEDSPPPIPPQLF